MNEGTLFIVATPIGNLEDITLRALRVLKEVDLIACEDTRVTKKLLNYYSIQTATISYFQHSKLSKISQITDILKTGKNVALVTDAGTPGISDPGNILVEAVLAENIAVVPIPGVSALAALISVAGTDMQQFLFLGFPPHKKGRETFFKKVIASEVPVVYYDSPHRVLKNLGLMDELCVCHPVLDTGSSKSHQLKNNPDSCLHENGKTLQSSVVSKKIILGRELTKVFEEIVRGSVSDIEKYFAEHTEKIKGEFVVIVQ